MVANHGLGWSVYAGMELVDLGYASADEAIRSLIGDVK